MCCVTHYIGINMLPMIISFRHKGLKELFEEGMTTRLPQERLRKIYKLLWNLHSAEILDELNESGLRLHRLKRPPLEGYYSIDVTGNYRLVFRFQSGIVEDVDFLDTHWSYMKRMIPKIPIHPGEILSEFFIEPRSLTMTDLAKKMNIPRPGLSAVIKGNADITPMLAAKLAKALRTTVQFWLNLQMNYELSMARKKDEESKKTSKTTKATT